MQVPMDESRHSGHFEVVSLRSLPLESASIAGGRIIHPHRATALHAGESPTFSIDALVSPGLTIGFLNYTGGVHIQTSQLNDSYHVNIPLDWPLRTASGDQTELISRRNAAVYRRGRAAVLEGWETGGRLIAVKIARDLLEQRAADLFRHPVRDVNFDQLCLPLDNPQGREWLTLLKLLTNGLSNAGSLTHSPVLSAVLQESVVSGLLLLTADPKLASPGAAADLSSENVVQLAVTYIDQHADQPITMSSLAGHLGVSTRHLQIAFRSELDTTPHEHLRAVRLERTRQDLTLATSNGASVAQIARKWGFSNLGRFAAHYAQVYGETPKATLRRQTS